MQINVSELLKEPIGATRDYKVDDCIDITENGNTSPVKCEIRLLKTNQGILVRGVVNTSVELGCGRCLNLFRCPVSLNVEEEYIPTIDIISGAPLAPPEDPVFFTINEHHVIDLTEAIRQYTLLAMPIKPLCLEDCAGLCPGCGQNLNQGPCDCPKQQSDPRWSKLIKLQQRIDN